jgi:Domain of unknown function (DUF4350)
MRERLLVLVLALGAFALFYTLMFPKPAPAQSALAAPLSSESGPNGYLAVWRWLQQQQVPTLSFRYRFDRLREQLPGTGHLLITTMPHRLPMRGAEFAQLNLWIDQGNTLLIMAGLDDTPAWEGLADDAFMQHLTRATQLRVKEVGRPQALPVLSPARVELQPLGSHPLLEGVGRISTVSELPASRFQADASDGAAVLDLAARADTHESALWLRRKGAGQVILCAFATPFTNEEVSRADNAKLLANIVGWSRSARGVVAFDDAHQGATALYDPAAFFGDPRLHRTLAWIVLLWLAFVLGPQRLRAAQSYWRPVAETAYVDAGGRYFNAMVEPRDASRRLMENFFGWLGQRLKVEDRGRIWEWLDRQASVTSAQREQLHELYTRIYSGDMVDLARLQNLLAQLTRSLQ